MIEYEDFGDSKVAQSIREGIARQQKFDNERNERKLKRAELEDLKRALVPVLATVEHEYHTDPDVTGQLWEQVEYVRSFARWVDRRLEKVK